MSTINPDNQAYYDELEDEVYRLRRRRAKVLVWQMLVTFFILGVQLVCSLWLFDDETREKCFLLWLGLIIGVGIAYTWWGARLGKKILKKSLECIDVKYARHKVMAG